jgi:beta-mannanase
MNAADGVMRSHSDLRRWIGAVTLLVVAIAAAIAISPIHVRAATLPCSVQFGLYETGTPWDPSMAAIRNLDTAINRHSSIVHWFAQWGDPGAGTFSANQPWMLSNVRSYSSVGVTGATPFITWEPWGPAPYSVSNNTFPLQRIAAGDFDSYIDSWATGLQHYGGSVMLDFAHEMDGNWYPWGYGVNGNTAADYVAAFRHVHDRFVVAGASNVLFVWNVNIWNPAGVDPTTFYPGDSYVDRLAINVFNWGSAGGGWASLSQGLNATGVYTKLAALSAKPLMLAEWSSAEAGPTDPPGAAKGQWILDAAQSLPTEFPRITAVVWFSWTNTPFALDSSPASLSAAATAFGGCSS